MPAGAGQDFDGSASLYVVVFRVEALDALPVLGAVTSPVVIRNRTAFSVKSSYHDHP